jgi:hypothetical protein
MNPTNLTTDMSLVWQYVQFFGFLMLALTAISLFIVRFWIAMRVTAKVQRRTQWFVPNAPESDEPRLAYHDASRPSFPRQSSPGRIPPSETRNHGLKRSA